MCSDAVASSTLTSKVWSGSVCDNSNFLLAYRAIQPLNTQQYGAAAANCRVGRQWRVLELDPSTAVLHTGQTQSKLIMSTVLLLLPLSQLAMSHRQALNHIMVIMGGSCPENEVMMAEMTACRNNDRDCVRLPPLHSLRRRLS